MPLFGNRDYASYRGVYGGTRLEHPDIGSWVVVRVGELAGDAYQVVALRGHAYHDFYRVYVSHPEITDLWFWPWEVEEWAELRLNESQDS